MIFRVLTLVLMMAAAFSVSCGRNNVGTQDVDSTLTADTPKVFVALHMLSQTEMRVLAASGETLSHLNLCHGSAADCKEGKAKDYAMRSAEQRSGRFFFITEQGFVPESNMLLHIVSAPSASERTLLRSFAIVAAPQAPGLPPPPGPGVAGEYNLAIADVFDQKSTNWCWAYASYHALRTYYYNIPVKEETGVQSWFTAMREFDSPTAFWDLMLQNRRTGDMGNPHQFIPIVQKAKSLPEGRKWKYLSTRSDMRQKAIRDVEANLREGIPTAYCRSQHCVTIYGFTTNGQGATEFSIADSSPSRKYKEAANRVAQRYTGLWTIERPGEVPTSESEDLEKYYEEHPLSTGGRD